MRFDGVTDMVDMGMVDDEAAYSHEVVWTDHAGNKLTMSFSEEKYEEFVVAMVDYAAVYEENISLRYANANLRRENREQRADLNAANIRIAEVKKLLDEGVLESGYTIESREWIVELEGGQGCKDAYVVDTRGAVAPRLRPRKERRKRWQ